MSGFFQSKLFLKRRLILDYIRRHQPVSRGDIQRVFSLSSSTTAHIVTELEKNGIIEESSIGIEQMPVGRPAGEIQLNPEIVFLAGLEFDREKLTGVITNINGEIIESTSTVIQDIKTQATDYLQELNNILFFLKDIMKDKWQQVSVIGIGSPGQVNSSTGVSLNYPLIKKWQDIPLATIMNAAFRLPVFVTNNSACFALGEAWSTALRPYRRVSSVLLRSGIGLGVADNLRLLDLSGGHSCEFGHMSINFNGPKCYCGLKGCLETYCSGMRIQKAMRKMGKRNGQEYLTIAKIADMAVEGDSFCAELIIETGKYLGIGINSLVNLLMPDVIVINSRLNRAENLLKEGMNKSLQHQEIHTGNRAIIFSENGDEVGAAGAALMALEHLIQIYW